MDVYASETVVFKPGQTRLVPLGIIVEAPEGFHWKLFLRSSVGWKRGFSLANGVGIVDHEYAGPEDEMKACLKAPECHQGYGYGPFFEIKMGERIGQILLERNYEIEWDEQEDRDFAGATRGGFGSTGT
jgi:dUTP pyrophosphatase